MPRIIWDIGFGVTNVGNVFTIADTTRGKIGMVPISDGTVWTDVTRYVRSWSVRIGATKGDDPTLRYEANTATVILNDPDRRFDPDNLAGPYVAGGVSQVEPMRRVRCRAVWNGVTYPIFYGYTDDFAPDYQGNFWTYVTMTATDAQKIFANIDRTAQAPVGAGENSGARISRVLTNLGWPLTDRIIATGDNTLQATTHEGNGLAELLLVQDSEHGDFFVDRAGVVTFRNRQASWESARSKTSQATFGDGGYEATGELPYADVKRSGSDDAMANVITIARAGGVAQVATNATSVARYLTKTFQRLDLLLETDAAALQYAKALLFEYGTARRRFTRLEFLRPRPQTENALWPKMLGMYIGDRITIRRRPKGGGAVIEQQALIRGFEFSSDGHLWNSAFVLQSADRFSYFTIDDDVLGRVGYSAIPY